MKIKSVKAKRWLGVAAGSALAMSASIAHAVTETESNDTFATANVGGTGNVTGSVGDNSLADLNDVDIFSFSLLDGQTFSSSISYTGLWNPVDTNPVMTLFMENGGNYYPVASTDPDSFGTSFSFTPWVSGDYFLTVTSDFNQGVDAFGNLQSSFEFLTTESILGTANAGFHGQSFTSFNYDITTTGAVPVPAAVWLFGSGLLGLVGAARRRNKA